jgi:uncharacterized protein YdaU (DUF1376 family)
MKAPWFPFYCGDFLASSDVQLMEAHEVGAYVLLLAHSWQSNTPGYLPNDEGRLRRLCRLSAEAWKECGPLLLSKWPVAENETVRHNPRLLKEAEKQVELRELKAEAGRKSAERRARLATGGQQTGNTNPTPVGNPATGVSENGNYSQSQPQSQSQEGKPSATSSFQSEVDAASAAAPAPVEEVVVEFLPESPATELRTPWGAGDVGTSVVLTKQRGGKWQAPSVDEVASYITGKRPRNPGCWQTEAERFVDYYTSNGWKVGRSAMQDWQAAVRNWLKKVPEVGSFVPQPITGQSTYNGAIGQRPSQVSTRAAAIAGADAMFDALAAGQDPLANRYP